ncbi:MAG: hypothetical protein ACI841_004492 [Planctomycetota bacterium]|jgi:hypothetical protein
MNVRLLVLATLIAAPLCSAITAQGSSIQKSDLRVLYVGDDPEAPKIMFADSADARTVELYQERNSAFTAFLTRRFANVSMVHGDDYNAELSDDVDVTIFDTRPKALTPSSRDIDPDTGEMDYKPATYLPDDFDRPALMISANSPVIGEPLGLKLDWL